MMRGVVVELRIARAILVTPASAIPLIKVAENTPAIMVRRAPEVSVSNPAAGLPIVLRQAKAAGVLAILFADRTWR